MSVFPSASQLPFGAPSTVFASASNFALIFSPAFPAASRFTSKRILLSSVQIWQSACFGQRFVDVFLVRRGADEEDLALSDFCCADQVFDAEITLADCFSVHRSLPRAPKWIV